MSVIAHESSLVGKGRGDVGEDGAGGPVGRALVAHVQQVGVQHQQVARRNVQADVRYLWRGCGRAASASTSDGSAPLVWCAAR